MKIKIASIITTVGLLTACNHLQNSETQITQAADWQAVPLPSEISARGEWQLFDALSDSFNYQGKTSHFYNKWHDNHIRGWKGPGATYFSAEHSDVLAGNLVLTASPVPEEQQGKVIDYGNFKSRKTIYTGFVTAKHTIEYPIYIEAKLKTSSLALANNFWMLSDDDRNEIDVTETYGDKPKTVSHMSTNYHIFKRDPVTNDYLEDYGHKQGFAETPDKAHLDEDFHLFGFYWASPTEMEFYLDGRKVRDLNTSNDLNDPDGLFFDRSMRVIFDMEDHVWRARKGITPTIEQLNNKQKNKMYVDWIRAYKPIK
ncbi:family 16 glycosylhydrolase [Algibacillus agarilyticus]|uniref:family 16 glycosylhydrolase n=1 Tax=Algibacillus agarilyticus TaxID=2234133 RepID=UPI001E3055EE|nr:family 16 glycosylhydrolase [Algibacillus agarilyticus]